MSQKVDFKVISLAFAVKNKFFGHFFHWSAEALVSNFRQYQIDMLIDNIFLYYTKKNHLSSRGKKLEMIVQSQLLKNSKNTTVYPLLL
jgi:hypothetical protein